MANFYVDHGAYASALGSTPTWGVPQEGDGSSKDAATAASIGSIAFTTVPTSGTISISGASVSTTGVIGAASADAAANALATNINATTNTVSTSVANNASNNANQLRNMVYARGPSGGAAAGTCEIMYRIGSGTLNYATNSNSQIASSLDGSPTVTQFAGGSGGCWGWVVNVSAIGVSNSIATAAYGMFNALSPTVWTSAPGANDKIYIRTENGRTITTAASSFALWTGANTTPTHHANYIFDTNTQWTSDSGTGVFTVEITLAASVYSYINTIAATGGVTLPRTVSAIMYGGFVIKAVGTASSSNLILSMGSGAMSRWKNVHFVESSEVVSTSKFYIMSATGYRSIAVFDNCLFDFQPPITALKAPLININSVSTNMSVEFNGCEFRWNITGVGDPGAIINVTSYYSYTTVLKFIACRFTGYSGKYRLFSAALTNRCSDFECVVDGCSGLSMGSSLLALSQYSGVPIQEDAATLQFSSQDAGRDFRLETIRGCCDWDSGASPAYPTLGAIQPDGTEWSLRYVVFSSLVHNYCHPFYGPKMSQLNRLSDGYRTVRLEMLWPDAYGATSDAVALGVGYVDVDGVSRYETTLLQSAPATSTASWTGAGSYTNHSPKYLTLTTQYQVKQYTDIAAWFALLAPATSSTHNLFVSPEFTLT